MISNSYKKNDEKREFTLMPTSYEIQMPVCDKQVMCEVSGDFILPDYLPEIKRLLRVSPKVCETSKYISSNTAQFSGAVNYSVLYADDEGKLYAASLASDYDIESKIADAGVTLSPDDVICDTEIESVTCRPVGPRKLLIKSRLCARVRAYNRGTIPERTVGAVSAEDEFSLERLRKVYPTAFVARAKGDEQYIEGEIMLDGAAGAKPVFCEASIALLDASCTADGVSYRAEVILRCLVESENGELQTCIKRFPISETITVSGAEQGCECRVWGNTDSLSVSAEAADDEKGTKLICSLTAVFEAEVQKNINASLTEDAFSTLCKCELSFKDYELPYVLRSLCTNLSFSHSLPLSSAGFSSGCRIVDVCGEAKVDKVAREGGKYVVFGKCRASVIGIDASPDSAEADIPFKYEIEGAVDEVSDYSANASVTSMRARIEGENMALDGDISLSIALFGKNSARVVDTLTLDRNSPYSDSQGVSSIVVCFPAKGDTLWSVAKRYHTSTAKIGQDGSDIGEYIIFAK